MNRKFSKGALIKAALVCVIASQSALARGEEPVAPVSSEEGQIWLTSGFFSHHMNRKKDFNETNTGLGVEYTLSRSTAVAIGHYENSVYKPSTYLHFVYTPLELGPLQLGGAVGLLNGYPALREGRFAPVVLPIGRVNFKVFNQDVGVNFTYIPTIGSRIDGAVAIQFRLRVW
jgi:hypothetical protein